MGWRDKAGGIVLGPVAAANGGGRGQISEDAVSALVNLGYRRAEAFAAVAKASGDPGRGASLVSLIKAGLKGLASSTTDGSDPNNGMYGKNLYVPPSSVCRPILKK